MKAKPPHVKYAKLSTLLSLSFYALFMLLQFAARNAGEGLAHAVNMFILLLFALLFFISPLVCAFKAARQNGRWWWLQALHLVCCAPLWFGYALMSAEGMAGKSHFEIQQVATNLFLILLLVSAAPLLGFLCAKISRNMLGLR